ncbi:MAG: carotenoid oxygenase family protein [Spirulinaceae cyanobacterium SM2_1_0]|nr:carotenoid oxygenase family protein [Spirulinaceae cyanobacterium SM2_1_0]
MDDSSTATAKPSQTPAVRRELDLQLQISGHLPDDLQGHVFIVGPVGTLSNPDDRTENTALNGDGMVYRLDFDQPGAVTLKSRLLRPFEYRADEITQREPRWSRLKFQDYGVVRFSKPLGVRNELNTAFLPLPGLEGQEQLLVTYDVGRPYLLDPDSLEVLSPIGQNREWRSAVQHSYLFKPIFSTAHPVYDCFTQDVFTVNYGRSIGNFLSAVPGMQALSALLRRIWHFSPYNVILQFLALPFTWLIQQLSRNPGFARRWQKLRQGLFPDFVDLLRWHGTGKLERWRLILPDGSHLSIKQTMHQIGVSKDYLVLLDTAFSTGIEQLFNNPLPRLPRLERFLRRWLELPPNADSLFYIVKRRDLERTPGDPADHDDPPQIRVRPVAIAGEAAHFLTDYENPDGNLTLHVSHICAWDVAEWIRSIDKLPRAYTQGRKNNFRRFSNPLAGQELNPMDISRLGRYTIAGEGTSAVPSQVRMVADTRYTWGTGLYAFRDRDAQNAPPQKLHNLYWTTFGLRKNLMTRFACQLYKHYRYQQVPQAEIIESVKDRDVPACLLRLDTQRMEIADIYEFPVNYFVSSPQFIPRRVASEGADTAIALSTDGYLSCVVLHLNPERNQLDRAEIWLFDGSALASGPLCKLHHPELQLNFTLHTAWLPVLTHAPETYRITPLEDYGETVAHYSRLFPWRVTRQVRQLFSELLHQLDAD